MQWLAFLMALVPVIARAITSEDIYGAIPPDAPYDSSLNFFDLLALAAMVGAFGVAFFRSKGFRKGVLLYAIVLAALVSLYVVLPQEWAIAVNVLGVILLLIWDVTTSAAHTRQLQEEARSNVVSPTERPNRGTSGADGSELGAPIVDLVEGEPMHHITESQPALDRYRSVVEVLEAEHWSTRPTDQSMQVLEPTSLEELRTRLLQLHPEDSDLDISAWDERDEVRRGVRGGS